MGRSGDWELIKEAISHFAGKKQSGTASESVYFRLINIIPKGK